MTSAPTRRLTELFSLMTHLLLHAKVGSCHIALVVRSTNRTSSVFVPLKQFQSCTHEFDNSKDYNRSQFLENYLQNIQNSLGDTQGKYWMVFCRLAQTFDKNLFLHLEEASLAVKKQYPA